MVDGQQLPSERSLSERLGIGRTVLRGILAELEDEGLVVQKKGGGRVFRIPTATSGHTVSILSGTITVLTSDPSPTGQHRQPGWVDHLTQGAIREVHASSHNALTLHPDRLKGGGLQQLLNARPVGVVVPDGYRSMNSTFDIVRRLAESGVPVVTYGGTENLLNLDRVVSDHEVGAGMLVDWMVRHGRRRLLNLWASPGDAPWQLARRRGYESGVAKAGVPALPLELFQVVPAVNMTERENFDIRVHQLAGHLVPWLLSAEPVDGLLLLNDGDVAVASSACRLLGREPNRDILIAGYDNFWADAPEREFDATAPAVTVDKRNEAMGHEMVRLLLDRIEGRLPPEPQTRTFPPELVSSGVLVG